jgi:broad specificity phosphatase PhoE
MMNRSENNIWLIRHGKSQSNAGEITISPCTTRLTKLGKKQAIKIAEDIRLKPDLVIYTSYFRTLQTAKPLLKKFPNVKTEQWPLHEFTYLNLKKYYKTTRKERRIDKKSYWSNLDPDYCAGNGAESFNFFLERIEAGLKKLKKQKGFVIVYTHGHVIRAIIWSLLVGKIKQDKDSFARYQHLRQALRVPNGAIVKLNFKERVPQISSIITDHLTDDG